MSDPAARETESFAVFPDPPPTELARFLDIGGYKWVAADQASTLVDGEQADRIPWAGSIVVVDDRPEDAWRFCRELRKRDAPVEPTLVLISGSRLDQLSTRDDLFDDFIIMPFLPQELEARIQHLQWQAGRGVRPELIAYGPLSLNVETYQAMLEDRPLDLTYMEYELLRFLAASPGQVFTREVLLNRVWGYEYYGGARTVDVHIRRLRAKMGEEHSSLISTVRGVGYKLGQSRWHTT
jgi:two-component system, OmpR family, alkaline phosphatase synthesis response regulator PhoP